MIGIVHRVRLVVFALMMNRKITAFIRGRPRQGWIFTPIGKFYVRKGAHMVPSELIATLDLANLEIYEQYQRRHYFATALYCFERRARANNVPAIYFENVHNDVLVDIITRRGYAPAQHDRCFYKRVNG
jgi:hypothetical protein